MRIICRRIVSWHILDAASLYAEILHFLSQHPEITEIEVCTDNDFAGRWACEHIRKAYEGNYQIIENLPEIEGADWADMAKMAARTPEKRQNREARWCLER